MYHRCLYMCYVSTFYVCDMAAGLLNLPISPLNQHVIAAAVTLFLHPPALFLWRRPVVGFCPRGVDGIYFGSFQHELAVG